MGAWTSILSVFLGAASALSGTVFAQIHQGKREREARADERAAAVRNRREEFELQHLVEFHRLLRDSEEALWTFAGKLSEYRRSYGSWDRAGRSGPAPEWVAPPAAKEMFEAANAAIWAQLGFLLSDHVRGLAEQAHHHAASSAETLLDGDDDPQMYEMSETFRAVHDAVSARVREIYAGRADGKP